MNYTEDLEMPEIEMEEELEIEKGVEFLPYPAVSLTGRNIFFNKHSCKYLTGPYISVSKGKSNGDWCLIFRNTDDRKHGFNLNKSSHGNTFRISAMHILKVIKLSEAHVTFLGRKLVKAPGGLAVKIYE